MDEWYRLEWWTPCTDWSYELELKIEPVHQSPIWFRLDSQIFRFGLILQPNVAYKMFYLAQRESFAQKWKFGRKSLKNGEFLSKKWRVWHQKRQNMVNFTKKWAKFNELWPKIVNLTDDSEGSIQFSNPTMDVLFLRDVATLKTYRENQKRQNPPIFLFEYTINQNNAKRQFNR